MVMGDNSCSKGHGFEFRRRILDGHFFRLICCTNCIDYLKRPTINGKEAGVGPFKKLRVISFLRLLLNEPFRAFFLIILSCNRLFINGPSQPLFRLFSSFQRNIFTTNKCEKMSIQYKVLGFEPITFET